jgi:RNA polymerase sigma-70 factor, ECF subfamily
VEAIMASGEMAFRTAETAATAVGEGSLVELCRKGDAEAFSRLVGLHEGMVYNLALRLLGNPEDAKDLSQDVFLQVYRTLSRFEGRSSLKTWIYRIVVNQSRNRQRWWRRRRRDRACGLEDLTAADELKVTQGKDEKTAFDEISRGERAQRMQRALGALSFDHRAILLLREVEELSCEEIATALSVPEGTVKSRLSRAREALRLQFVTEAP